MWSQDDDDGLLLEFVACKPPLDCNTNIVLVVRLEAGTPSQQFTATIYLLDWNTFPTVDCTLHGLNTIHTED